MPDARIHVDFNDIEDDGRLGALASSADDPSALRPGALLELWDEEGNTAQGRVAELADRGLVWIELLGDTWRSGIEVRSAEQIITASLAGLTIATALTVGGATTAATYFAGPALPDLYGLFLFAPSWRVGFAPPTLGHGAASSALGRDFSEYYKLRLVTGVAPVTADVGS